MKDALAKLETILKQNTCHVTYARKQVFLALYDKKPQSIHDLSTRLNGKINRTSIYRVVELFEKLGITHRIQIGWKYKIELSDIFVEHHHHISCVSCGHIFAVAAEEKLEKLINELCKKNDIIHTKHQLEIQGYCKKCAPKQLSH